MPIEKTCSKCGLTKLLEEFKKDKSTKSGRTTYCKKCNNKESMEWQRANRGKSRKIQLDHYYRHQEERQLAHRIYAKQNRIKETERARQWRKNNPERFAAMRAKYHSGIRKTPFGKLNLLMRQYIWRALSGKKNGQAWTKLVGYSLDDLRQHLSKTIPKGFTWDDYLCGDLHVDHIIPVSAFNFKTQYDIDFKRCWDLENLRLLPAKENMSKGSKLEKPFQPSLAFGGHYGTSGKLYNNRAL